MRWNHDFSPGLTCSSGFYKGGGGHLPAKLKAKCKIMLWGVQVLGRNEKRKWCLDRQQPLVLYESTASADPLISTRARAQRASLAMTLGTRTLGLQSYFLFLFLL